MSTHEEDVGGIAAGEAKAGVGNVAAPRQPAMAAPLVEFFLRLGDDRLILGHRMSEWTGHGPILEEDIATANIALDLIGQAAQLLKLAGETEGKGRDENVLAYFRDGTQFRNCLLVELPRGDFGDTMVRQFFFDAYSVLQLDEFTRCGHAQLAAIAAKALKEDKYHLRHSSEWVVRLGDGTPESQARIQASVNRLWKYTGELFVSDEIDTAVQSAGITIDMAGITSRWDSLVSDVLTRATITRPPDGPMQRGGRRGKHTEHIGHLLATMQSVARAHPGANW